MEAAALIASALEEDIGAGDFTTQWTVPAESVNRAVVVAKQPLTVSGIELARAVFARVAPDLDVLVEVDDGGSAANEQVVARIHGKTRGILTGERVALNFLGRLSGVATFTRRFVEAVAGTGAEIIDTRKTTPGWRVLEKRAVRDGGGTNHRMGLFDMVMIKDNHIAAAGGPEEAVARVRDHNHLGIPVQVEVTSIEELTRVLPLGVDRILLDNMALDVLRDAVRRVHDYGEPAPVTEASGNVSLATVRSIAETGVDQISVGALTHSAPVADFSLRIVG